MFLALLPIATSEVQIQGAGHQLQTQGVGIQDTFASGKSWTVMDLESATFQNLVHLEVIIGCTCRTSNIYIYIYIYGQLIWTNHVIYIYIHKCEILNVIYIYIHINGPLRINPRLTYVSIRVVSSLICTLSSILKRYMSIINW